MNILISILSWALINLSGAYLRESPDYCSQCVSQTRMGTLVEVLESDRYWRKVRTPEPYEGWINAMTLVEISDAEKEAWLSAPRFIFTAESGHIYTSPSLSSERICDFVMGNILRQGSRKTGSWTEVQMADGRKGWVRSAEVMDFRTWAVNSRPEPESIIALAKRFLGVPYFWGGMSVKGFDCSGLVGFCYWMHGVLLPRDASQQVSCGVEVPLELMQPGDLVYFGETRVAHVGMCIAPGRIIHSSQLVRMNSIVPGTADYYSRHIISVRRMLTEIEKGTGVASIDLSPLYFKQ